MNNFYTVQYLTWGIVLLIFGLFVAYGGHKLRQNLDPDGLGALFFVVGIVLSVAGVVLIMLTGEIK